ncbi:MAG TPA: carbohydrate kinase family protein [Thermoplasmata archaeon]|nr:carbohydrate kinase family protein [Thermoplasmata archaeon]
MLDTVAVGDICVDLLTPPLKDFSLGDRQFWVPAMPMVPGGNATNFALGTVALGLRTGLAACIGGDPISEFLRIAVRRARVVSFLVARRGHDAGRTVALTQADGSRTMITYNGANLAFTRPDVAAKALDCRHLHRAGYWWTPKLQGRPTRDLFRRARDRGAATSLDVSTDPEGWPDRRRAKVLEVLPEVSVFFGNEVEVRGVFAARDLKTAANESSALGVEVLAVHRGPRGCSLFLRRRRVDVPAFRVAPRNPTGAGDLFNAGFVYARLQGWDLWRSGRFANAVAARHLEGQNPYPKRSEVDRQFPSR